MVLKNLSLGEGRYATIDADRLWRRHVEMARFGATARGGVNRLALTQIDIDAHVVLAQWASERGFSVFVDDTGNMFIRRVGSDQEAAPVTSGSHCDTQPTGGRFDGIFGVLAALEALDAIEDAGLVTRRPLEAAVWNNEEGVRFTPSYMGSAIYAGGIALEAMLAATDSSGATMGSAVQALKAALPNASHRPLGTPISAFVEAHIEQGPELEAAGDTIGIVTGMQGTRKFSIDVTGDEAHAGTTPRRHRRDAFVEAIAIVNALHELFHDADDTVRFTIGQFEVFPGALAVVPGRVSFSIDFRHPEQETLERLGNQVEPLCQRIVERCTVSVNEPSSAKPLRFIGVVPEVIERAVGRRGYPYRHIYSGAGHDARHLAGLCPSGMIFVPCEKGISHNEAENASPADLAAGAQIIADVMVDLANGD
jgi:N-carbamoyl-L-amino-acid hydrolase